MSPLVVALLASAVGMPPATAGAPTKADVRRMAAQPLPDETLDKGTVSVLVRGGKVEGVEVLLQPAAGGGEGDASNPEILAGGKTNAEGRLFLKAAVHAGREVRVLVKAAGGAQWSVPFSVPLMGGVRLLFVVGEQASPHGMGDAGGDANPHAGGGHGADPGQASPSGPTTRDPSGLRLWMAFRVIAIEGGALYMGVTYTLLQSGTQTYDPGEHGLLLPVPQGNKSVSLSHRGRGLKAEKQGILLTRSVPTGRHGLQFTANVKLPGDRATLDVRLGSAIPIIGYSASLKAYPTVRVVGPSLQPPETIEGSAEHGGKLLVYRSSPEGFPRTTLSFQVTGIPVRSRARSFPFALVAMVLLLGGIILVVVKGGPSAPKTQASGASSGGEDTVQALVDLERDRLLGRLDAAAFEAERRRLLGTGQ